MTISKVTAFTGEKRPIPTKPKEILFLHGEDEGFYRNHVVGQFDKLKGALYFYRLWDDVYENLQDTNPVALVIDINHKTHHPDLYPSGIANVLDYINEKYPFLPVMLYSLVPEDEAKLWELKKQYPCVKEIAVLSANNLDLVDKFLESKHSDLASIVRPHYGLRSFGSIDENLGIDLSSIGNNKPYAIYCFRGYGYQFGGPNGDGDYGSLYHHVLERSVNILSRAALDYVIKASVFGLFSEFSDRLKDFIQQNGGMSMEDCQLIEEFCERQAELFSDKCLEEELVSGPLSKVFYEEDDIKIYLKDWELFYANGVTKKRLPDSLANLAQRDLDSFVKLVLAYEKFNEEVSVGCKKSGTDEFPSRVE